MQLWLNLDSSQEEGSNINSIMKLSVLSYCSLPKIVWAGEVAGSRSRAPGQYWRARGYVGRMSFTGYIMVTMQPDTVVLIVASSIDQFCWNHKCLINFSAYKVIQHPTHQCVKLMSTSTGEISCLWLFQICWMTKEKLIILVAINKNSISLPVLIRHYY